jgi:hypothetical protein
MRISHRLLARRRAATAWGGIAAIVALSTAGGAAIPARAAGALTLTFVPHGAFFSTETHQTTAIDPQVFVRSAGAAAGVGPQRIAHAAGYLPARLTDPPNTLLHGADGVPLNITLGQWLNGGGTVFLHPITGRRQRVTAFFTGLIPRGTYSLFEVTFRPGGNEFAPLDGTGASNTFMADDHGRGGLTVSTPTPLTHANAVLLVYHSDGRAHGKDRGRPGISAHHQLIARLP